LRIASLHVYPVKSCGSLDLSEARLDALGLDGDRRYAILDPAGRALTQRRYPAMASIRPRLLPGALALDLGGLSAIEAPEVDFGTACGAAVWGNLVPARAATEAINDRLSDYLGTAARLVRLGDDAGRSFADARPVLVLTLASLAILNAALESPLGIERFRGNIVIDGAAPLAELGWQRLASGTAGLEFEQHCERCEVTTIEQASGRSAGEEPLRTIATSFDSVFGAYFRVTRPGRVAVGAALLPG
jgi:hypothetical protein